MNMTDELERLAQLHKSGALTDDEFAQAKAKLINPPAEQYQPPPNSTLGEAANRYVSYQVIMGIIGFIVFIIFFFGVIFPHLHSGPTMHFDAR
jgi:hypothetical protein